MAEETKSTSIMLLESEALNLAREGEKSCTISNQTDFEKASKIEARIKTMIKNARAEEKGLKTPMQVAIKTIKGWFDTICEPLETTQSTIGRAKNAYFAEMEAVRVRTQKLIDEQAKATFEANVKEDIPNPLPVPVAPIIPKVNTKVKTDDGTITMRDNWKYEVLDEAAVPTMYKVEIINHVILKASVSSGSREIAGVRIYNDPYPVLRK